MKKHTLVAALGLALLSAGFAYAQTRTYKYKCIKCGQIVEYSQPKPGMKCPSGDGTIMNQIN